MQKHVYTSLRFTSTLLAEPCGNRRMQAQMQTLAVVEQAGRTEQLDQQAVSTGSRQVARQDYRCVSQAFNRRTTGLW